MKRINNLYDQICSIENLELADLLASQGKSKQYGVIVHNQNKAANILELHHSLVNQTFTTSAYRTFTIYEPKQREICSLPYYPDRIVHHAVMVILEPIFKSLFTSDTYSSIRGKGIHAAAEAVKNALRNKKGTRYCLKLDIKKFYPNIDHDILKQLLRRKFKDAKLLALLDGIIDSAPGVPIGNYLSQYFANLYLTGFDHWIKEEKRVQYYFRYADDIVILAADKPTLHNLFTDIQQYLQDNIKLQVKGNYQVFPIAARSLDFVGYRFYHTHTLLRKTIKKSFARMMATHRSPASLAAYNGWAKHCDSKHLIKTLLNEAV